MGDFSHIFSGIQNAKPVSSFTPRLPVGKHIVAIKRYAGKNSQSAMGVILELDCVVMQTNADLRAGESRGWAWFPGQSGWGGQYEQGRAKEFIENVGRCAGDNRDVSAVGDSLTQGAYLGVLVGCDVTQNFERDGITPKKDKKGNPTFNASWFEVPGQTAESVQAVRAQLASLEAPPAAPFQAAQSPAQHTQAAFSAPVATPAPAAAPVAAPAFGGFTAAPAAAPTQTTAAAPAANPLAGILGGLKK